MSSIKFTFEEIRAQKQGAAERIGEPDELTSALGRAIFGFSWLARTMDRHLLALAGLVPEAASALTTRMSFEARIAAVSSLVKMQLPSPRPDCGEEDAGDVWADIVTMLYECENIRNKFVNSHWSLPHNGSIRRSTATANAERGLTLVDEDLTADYLIDGYDYVLNVESVLDEFFPLSQ